MKQRLEGFVMGLVVALALGGTAGAATQFGHLVSQKSPSPKAGQHAASPGQSGSKGDQSGSDANPSDANKAEAGNGLDTAIAHVSANLAAHPNKGLQVALDHLKANQARQQTGQGNSGH